MTQDFKVTRAEERWLRWLQQREADLKKEVAEFWDDFCAARGITPGVKINLDLNAMTYTMALPETPHVDAVDDEG